MKIKKHITVPCGVCLLLIALSACFIYSTYTARVDAEKKLLEAYLSETKASVHTVVGSPDGLPYVASPLIDGRQTLGENVKIHVENVRLIEDYYTANSSYIKGISLYDNHGDVFHIYQDKDSSFIEDVYASRVIKVLRPKRDLEIDENSLSIILPVYFGDSLTGNMAISLNVESILDTLFHPFIAKNIWPTSVLDRNMLITYPLETDWMLSGQQDIVKGMDENISGFVRGKIEGEGYTGATVMSCYENLCISGHFMGFVFSSNLSPLIRSAMVQFAVICLALLTITAAAVYILHRIMTRNREEADRQNQLINLMQMVYQKASLGIVVTQQNKLYAINESAIRMLERHLSESDLGKDAGDIPFLADIRNSDELQEFQHWNITVTEHDGVEQYLGRKYMTFVVDGINYSLSTFCNFTEIEQSRKKAVRSDLAKSEMLSRISSDLKKSLGNIEDAVVLLMQKYPNEPDVLHVHRAALALSGMIDNVLDFADIDAGLVVLDEMPFNVVDELKKVTEAYTRAAQQKGVDLQVHIAASAVRNVVGDPQRFRQVLDHLLSNAVKFTGKGIIRITMETADLQEKKVQIKCSVEDTGQGMSKQKLKNLFSIDMRTREKGESIGLGMMVARKLITMMGGTIRATSPSPIATAPDAPGTQFAFTIQCYSDQPFDKHLNYSHIKTYSQINVLIISSGGHQVQYLSNSLKRKGMNVDTFIYSRDMAELLPNKLIVDRDRYQMIVIEAADSDTSFTIAGEIHQKGLTGHCLYVLIDAYHQKGNYLRAKSLYMDYYFVQSEDLSGFDPVLKEHFVSLSEAVYSSGDLRKDIHIMIAENNSLSQTVAQVVFRKLGYEVDFARNALELISQMNQKTYDIIFIDLKFPPADGFEIATMLRQKGYRLPVIAMSSTQTKENLKNISDAGMNGYVPKPLNVENIKNILLKWFV